MLNNLETSYLVKGPVQCSIINFAILVMALARFLIVMGRTLLYQTLNELQTQMC